MNRGTLQPLVDMPELPIVLSHEATFSSSVFSTSPSQDMTPGGANKHQRKETGLKGGRRVSDGEQVSRG